MALTEVKLGQEEDQVKTTKLAETDGFMLCDAMETLKPILPAEIQNPMKTLEFLACNNRSTAFPNLFIALRIFLAIPVTVASGEMRFFQAETDQNLLEIINSARTFEQFGNYVH